MTIADRLAGLIWTGATGPLQPKSSKATMILLILTCCVFATTTGYDAGLINGINIMPQYSSHFHLTTVTKALNSCANYIGWFIAALFMAPVIDRVGRKSGVVLSVLLKLVGVSLMCAAPSVPCFVVGRIILGWAHGTSGIAAAAWLAETLPPHLRGRGLSFAYSVFFVGALLAAGVCYASAGIPGDWSWRLPCLLMVVWAAACTATLLATPESPRWLANKGRHEEARKALATIYSDTGDVEDVVVVREFQDILDRMRWETEMKASEGGSEIGFKEMVRTPGARRQVMLAMSVGVLVSLTGNNIVSYYLGDMLTQAGIYDSDVQLQINIVLNAWALCLALLGTALMDKVGRKPLCLFACCGTAISMFLVGTMTKFYGDGSNLSGAYGTVAMIFIFQGCYSVGITPITTLYPPEVLGYRIRTTGLAAWGFTVNILGVFSTFVMPIALAAIGWKLYLINGGWDILQALFVGFFWIETKGMSLEDIDRLIMGRTGADEELAVDEKVVRDGSLDVVEGADVKKIGSVVDVNPIA